MPIYYINCYKLIIKTRFIAEEALNEESIVTMYVCTCVRTCLMLRNVNLHSFVFSYVHVRSWTHASRALTMEVPVEDKEERHLLTRRTALLAICNVHVLHSWVLNAADGWRHWEKESNEQSQCTKEAKRARREREKVQKKKARCGESSQARYKLCFLSCSIQPYSFLSLD